MRGLQHQKTKNLGILLLKKQSQFKRLRKS